MQALLHDWDLFRQEVGGHLLFFRGGGTSVRQFYGPIHLSFRSESAIVQYAAGEVARPVFYKVVIKEVEGLRRGDCVLAVVAAFEAVRRVEFLQQRIAHVATEEDVDAA